MFGTLEKLYYFCGVREQIIAFEYNEIFVKTFCSNACIYQLFVLYLYHN